ncbi:Por secretion system C-terminal sorting domain-containing protein [Paenimyroides aquimaris]|uniref:Por secretion system C-terminal sorting domain-containing protein n=1 Tax=Paenimyroides marinum TaxID=1159016 RepID=A0A1H6MWP4_9FLAO|nr:T9SS type A sorting domain-containing protein [Paenimyroides aquimaris]SEI02231.1 Por secretion system C-terminal sorting domain-containing protein [Paenimyroides aquimaris]
MLYSENFDNLTLGNVGTDPTGQTAGQGGWYTFCDTNPSDVNNNYFRIVSEANKGKVLELEGLSNSGLNYIQKREIDVLWNTRTPGNDILKIEYDFFTGDNTNVTNSYHHFCIRSDNNFDYVSSSLGFFSYLQQLEVVNFGAFSTCNNITNGSITLPKNTWTKLIYYLDFQNKKVYFHIPTLNLIVRCNLASNSIAKSFFFLLRGSGIALYKFDNFVISAVDTPPLSVQDFISNKFNLYPSPSKNIINITNNENIGVEQVTIFDVNGKLVKTKVFNKEHNVQINVSAFAAGTYLLHIYSADGIAIKKIIKE